MPVDTTPRKDPLQEMDEVAKTNLRRLWIGVGILVTAGVIVALYYLPIW